MSPISKAITEVKYRIPPEILHTVFVSRLERWRDTPKSVDEQILSLVLRPRVLIDCNLVGGREIWVCLDGLMCSGGFAEGYYETVFRVPKRLTNGASILSVLNVSFGNPAMFSAAGVVALSQGSTMLQAGQAVVDAMGSIPITSTARIELIGENVVLVRDVMVMPPNAWLNCVVANDENLNNIQLRSYHHFAKLVEYAVKSYIYNVYVIQLDIGELRGGQSLGRIKEIIDGYADAEQNYQDFIGTRWRKVAFMNDPGAWNRSLRMRLGGNR